MISKLTLNRSTMIVYSGLLLSFVCLARAQFEWQTRDAVDEIRSRMDGVNGDNCPISHLGDLYLPEDSVSHLPDIKDININPVFPNRTALLHLHNMALNRAFFYSYTLQSRFIRPALNDTYDPGMMYYFLSSVADVAANPFINASAIYFAPNSSYSPSYRGFFNKTMPLFAPRTYRMDDFNDPIHLERISTLNTFTVQDLGAIPNGSLSLDYTSDFYRINEWYRQWLPDNVKERQDTKITYDVKIRYANNTNETFSFHGPPGADEYPGPVKWTRPYFDCGRSNKWLVSAVVPIADLYPRHTGFRHIEYPTYTAIAVLEMDFDRIDINQCPKAEGNSGPNRFANSARCKKETTECEPIHGWGFRRGGYQCRCIPGYRLPPNVRRPYLGEIIERATTEQYFHGGFNCERISWIHKSPVQWGRVPAWMRERYLEMYYEYRNVSYDHRYYTSDSDSYRDRDRDRDRDSTDRYSPRDRDPYNRDGDRFRDPNSRFRDQDRNYNNRDFNRSRPDQNNYQKIPLGPEKQSPFSSEQRHSGRINVEKAVKFILQVNPSNCKEYAPQDLILNGDVAYGFEEQFHNEARMAVRLANFISGFLQIVDPHEVYSGTRVADPPLTEDQMIAETLAIVMGDSKIWSAGTFWDRDKFTNRSLFAPFAYKEKLNTRKFKVEDLARLNKSDEVYLNEEWFKFLKQRWTSNFDSLEKINMKIKIRFNETGQYMKKYEQYPNFYRAASLDHGFWTRPRYHCDGRVKKWLITYAAPFFGWDSLRARLEFKGVVAVSMSLLNLDINQCPNKYYAPNAFKDTHKCDLRTSYCVPILGRGFETGGYKCECLQGFEYPFEDSITYFDGQLVEAEFLNIVADKESRFDMFKCRLSGSCGLHNSLLLTVFGTVLLLWRALIRATV